MDADRNLLFAVLALQADLITLPGFNNNLEPTESGTNNQCRSLTFTILPYMDHRALYDHLADEDIANHLVKQSIEIGTCPSDPRREAGDRMSYVVNTGQLDYLETPNRPADFPENGVFHRGVPRIAGEPLISMSASYVSDHDGLSNTLLMSENADARFWTDTGERWTGFTYHHADGKPGFSGTALHPSQSLGINAMPGWSHQLKPQGTARGFARPASYHHEGVNVAFCDSHVRFMSKLTTYRVYQAVMTPHGAGARDNSTPWGAPFLSGHAATEELREVEMR